MGTIFDIKKFAIHDGPGIRTTVFFKGCSLRCVWCHNPESIDKEQELFYTQSKCIACGACVEVCPEGCHAMKNGVHEFVRDNCTVCGKCVEVCHAGALELVGKEMSSDAVMTEVLKDRAFYETSGGGMTLSGGEPMLQPEFARELLEKAKTAQLHTCVDTCGSVPYERYEAIIGLVDLFLYDIKEADSQKHEKCTGAGNELILENLRKLDAAGASIVLRCPIVPGMNDREDHFRAIGDLASSLKGVQEINVMAYHAYGSSKSQRLGKSFDEDMDKVADASDPKEWLEAIGSFTTVPVKRG
jgi:glycyl-radical enzyme activating protein